VRLGAVTNANGASTVMVVEAGDPMPWTKPEDISFDAKGPFGGPKRLSFLALFADGHPQTMSATDAFGTSERPV